MLYPFAAGLLVSLFPFFLNDEVLCKRCWRCLSVCLSVCLPRKGMAIFVSGGLGRDVVVAYIRVRHKQCKIVRSRSFDSQSTQKNCYFETCVPPSGCLATSFVSTMPLETAGFHCGWREAFRAPDGSALAFGLSLPPHVTRRSVRQVRSIAQGSSFRAQQSNLQLRYCARELMEKREK